MSLVPPSSPSTTLSEQSPPSYWDVIGDVSFESATTTDVEKQSDIQEEIDDDTAVDDDVADDDILMMSVNKSDHIYDAENAIVSNKKKNIANIVERQKEDVVSQSSSHLASVVIVPSSNTQFSDQSTMTVTTAQSDENKVLRRKSRRNRYDRRFTGYANNNQRSASSPTDTQHVDGVNYSSSHISTTRGRHSDANQLPTAVNAMYDQLDNMLERLSRCSHDELFLHRRNIVDKLVFWQERFHRRLYASSNGGWYWRNKTKLRFRDCQCTSGTSAKHRCDCSSVQDRVIDTTQPNRIYHNSVDNCDNKEEPRESTPKIKLTRDSSGGKSNRPWEFEIVVQPSHRQFQHPDNEHMDWAVEASKQTATE